MYQIRWLWPWSWYVRLSGKVISRSGTRKIFMFESQVCPLTIWSPCAGQETFLNLCFLIYKIDMRRKGKLTFVEHLLYMRVSVGISGIFSFETSQSCKMASFYTWGNWGSKQSNKFPSITQLLSDEARIHIWVRLPLEPVEAWFSLWGS